MMDWIASLPLGWAILLFWSLAIVRATTTYALARGIAAGAARTSLRRHLSGPLYLRAMSLSLYDVSVPVLKQLLGALGHVLAKAEAHVDQKKLEPAALLQARLCPDMFAFTRQVQIACDFAKGMSARLAGKEPPVEEEGA